MPLSRANGKTEKKSLLPLFSSGQELASLAVSSGLLKLSCAKISQLNNELNQNEKITWGVYQESNFLIIPFGTSPTWANQLLQEEELVSSTSLPQFHFLRSKRSSSFSIHKAAATLFCCLDNQLFNLKTQVEQFEGLFKDRTRLIITGHSLGGSVASLFTLWLLDSINQKENKHKSVIKHTHCVTFGAPLLGDKGFQDAISCSSLWNSCFLHVAAKQDLVPRLFISPQNPNAMDIDSQMGAYTPFGTFLLCSACGCTCAEDPNAVSELLEAMSLEMAGIQNSNEAWQIYDYGRLVEYLMSIVIIKGLSELGESAVDTLRAGIVLQLEAIGVISVQQNSVNRELIAKMERREKDSLLKKKMAFDPSRKLNEIKKHMAQLEWYKKTCVSDKRGYYDSYKSRGSSQKDIEVSKFKKHLNNYWEKMVAEAERKTQTEEAAFMTRWLYGGTNYRRMVEPLDIADYYSKGLRDYRTNGRSQHFIRLEQWLDEAKELEAKKQNVSARSTDSKKQKVAALLTEDSCFWADVEEALILCKSLRDGDQRESTRKNLIKFEEDVMKQINNYAVSPEIFLAGSSFMRWWREYEEIIGTSYSSQLIHFMRNGLFNQYGSGS